MCGILITTSSQDSFSHQSLKRLTKRGPDGIGFWVNPDIQMGHTRLAIIGLDERGVEPMENERYVLTFNGEIYNFLQFKPRLASKGYPVAGANDAEILLYAWTEWGIDILKEFTGFWAFIIYDKLERTITLVRDQMGVKPLYYWKGKDGFAAASMMSTVLDAIPQKPSLNFQALSEYARYQFTFSDHTFLNDIYKVKPGHVVTYHIGSRKLTSFEYEDISRRTIDKPQKITKRWIDKTREQMREWVLESTISDTSFTTFCSGGLDSSLITRLTQPELAYHSNYSDPDCNETLWARRAVEDTDIRLFVVNAQEDFSLVDRLDDILDDFDELSIGSVILPLDDLLAQVKRRYKVILTGTGGDELFAGYTRYHLAMGQCNQESYRRMFKRMEPLHSLEERFEFTHVKGEIDLYRFYNSGAQDAFFDEFRKCKQGSSDLEAMLRFDRKFFLAGLLNIDDKLCGRHSLEGRPSFLNQKFIRHIVNLDQEQLLPGKDLKPVVRSLASGYLPESIIQREDKMGFTTPIGDFVNNSAHLIREHILNSKYLDFYNLENMNFTAETKFSREAFGLLTLDLWLNKNMSV